MARRRITPHQRVNTIYELDMDSLYASGIRYLMIDVDNTLVATGASDISEELRRWMDGAKRRFSVCLLSNSNRKRILMLSRVFGVEGIYYSMKPTGWGYRRAAHKLGVKDPSSVCVVGDQLYTDIWMGLRMGCHTVLVTPCSDVDHFWTRALRRIEQKRLLRHESQKHREGS